MMEEESTGSGCVCALHPGVAVTGFCPACLRDRLAGLHPPSADLRRCKSFSNYARSSNSYLDHPHRRSCDARQPPPILLPEPEDTIARPMKEHISLQQESRNGALGALGKRWQEWRRKTKLKKQNHHTGPTTTTRPLPPDSSSLARRSCDAFSSRTMLGFDEPRASCDHRPLFVPRSDDQIPVEEEEDEDAYEAVPGGTTQTRDYYLDSSSSSRRRRSVDRKSFSSDTEFYQHQQQVSNQYHHRQPSLEPPFLGREEAAKQSKHKSKGIKGWSIWGLLHKKNSSSSSFGGEAARATAPELRARGYDGQMLRCNSSVSARNSFSGSGLGRIRRADEVLLERNFSARYSSSSSCRMSQLHNNSNSIANIYRGGGGRPPRSSATSRTSLGLYYY
uniref:DUF740 family protein n=1 Tax=Oryza brachyantha TaxID=4533 RepID=J3NAI5_ORYBR